MNVLVFCIGIFVWTIIVFWAGLLVGRNNPKVANKASELADSAVEKAKEQAKRIKE